ncbi:uncharacterized protein LOC143893706 isoform X1 [Temnothorax americanus]|uniref:uncharacterized protein LOC143893706 isoform X1 n=1 Tax=Temnothorax americanus TaxID=1964332 RepID=UPI004067DB16
MKERSKFKISIAWDFIVEDLKDTFPDISSFFNPIVVQSKWKSLVDYFWRKVASRPKTTGSAAAAPESWPYFENMTFLQEIQTKQKTIDNFPEEDKENKTNEKIRRGRTNENNNGIEKIASALTELAKAPSIIPPPLPAPLPQNTTQSKLTLKEKKIRDFLQLMESLMLSIPDADLDNVLFSIHETVHKAKK